MLHTYYILCVWSSCVEQPATQVAVYRRLAGHIQEQTELKTFLFDTDAH